MTISFISTCTELRHPLLLKEIIMMSHAENIWAIYNTIKTCFQHLFKSYHENKCFDNEERISDTCNIDGAEIMNSLIHENQIELLYLILNDNQYILNTKWYSIIYAKTVSGAIRSNDIRLLRIFLKFSPTNYVRYQVTPKYNRVTANKAMRLFYRRVLKNAIEVSNENNIYYWFHPFELTDSSDAIKTCVIEHV